MCSGNFFKMLMETVNNSDRFMVLARTSMKETTRILVWTQLVFPPWQCSCTHNTFHSDVFFFPLKTHKTPMVFLSSGFTAVLQPDFCPLAFCLLFPKLRGSLSQWRKYKKNYWSSYSKFCQNHIWNVGRSINATGIVLIHDGTISKVLLCNKIYLLHMFFLITLRTFEQILYLSL